MKLSRIEQKNLKIAVAQKLGQDLPDEVYRKALAKYRRWMKAAYGEEDWQEGAEAEHVDALCMYCRETSREPSGRITFNRGRTA